VLVFCIHHVRPLLTPKVGKEAEYGFITVTKSAKANIAFSTQDPANAFSTGVFPWTTRMVVVDNQSLVVSLVSMGPASLAGISHRLKHLLAFL
jgi:hypothetical protein